MCSCISSKWFVLLVAGSAVIAGGLYANKVFNSDAETTPATIPEAEVIPSSFAQPEDPMADPMMAAMAEWGALAPEHEFLKGMVGTWDVTTSFNMGGPEPMVSSGTSTNTLILGGRYVTQQFVIPDFMGAGYEGLGTFGYDKVKGKYVSTWLDTMSTSMVFMEGTWDEDTSTLTWYGEGNSPMGKSKMKYLTKIIDDDNSVMEFYEASEMTGGEFVKSGTITYTRQK